MPAAGFGQRVGNCLDEGRQFVRRIPIDENYFVILRKKLGKNEDAITHYKKALELKPESDYSQKLRENLGLVEASQGGSEPSKEEVEEPEERPAAKAPPKPEAPKEDEDDVAELEELDEEPKPAPAPKAPAPAPKQGPAPVAKPASPPKTDDGFEEVGEEDSFEEVEMADDKKK